MKIIEINKSGLSKGEFLNMYHFEDDTMVFEGPDGWYCENINNIHSDEYYIDRARQNLRRLEMESNDGFYSIQLYDYKDRVNCFGHTNTEDRYIVLDPSGMDEFGSNFTFEEAEELCKELNEDDSLTDQQQMYPREY